jgi:hypothetical protein
MFKTAQENGYTATIYRCGQGLTFQIHRDGMWSLSAMHNEDRYMISMQTSSLAGLQCSEVQGSIADMMYAVEEMIGDVHSEEVIAFIEDALHSRDHSYRV